MIMTQSVQFGGVLFCLAHGHASLVWILRKSFVSRMGRSLIIWWRRWSLIFFQPRVSSSVRKQPKHNPLFPSNLHSSMQGDLTATTALFQVSADDVDQLVCTLHAFGFALDIRTGHVFADVVFNHLRH